MNPAVSSLVQSERWGHVEVQDMDHVRSGQPLLRDASRSTLQGYLAHKKQHPPP